MFLDLSGHGVDGARTRDLPRVRRTLSRLSYHPICTHLPENRANEIIIYQTFQSAYLFFYFLFSLPFSHKTAHSFVRPAS